MNSFTGLIAFLGILGGTLALFIIGVLIASAIEEYLARRNED